MCARKRSRATSGSAARNTWSLPNAPTAKKSASPAARSFSSAAPSRLPVKTALAKRASSASASSTARTPGTASTVVAPQSIAAASRAASAAFEPRERRLVDRRRRARERQQLGGDRRIGLPVGPHARELHVDVERVAHREVEGHRPRSVTRVQDRAVEIEEQELHGSRLAELHRERLAEAGGVTNADRRTLVDLAHTLYEPATAGPHPTIIALHGWGASAFDLMGLAPYLGGGSSK